MNFFIYVCAAIVLLLGIAFVLILVDLIRDFWH